jgi:hypothetical protein
MKQRGKAPDRVGRSQADPERVEKAKQTEAKVLRSYREIAKALATSADVEDRKLAVGIVHRLGEQHRQVQRDQSKGTER